MLFTLPEFNLIKIETCPNTIMRRNNMNDLCKNTRTCLIHKSYVIGNRVWNTSKKVVCTCIGKYEFECGSNHCSKNMLSCDRFLKSNKKEQTISQIKICEK